MPEAEFHRAILALELAPPKSRASVNSENRRNTLAESFTGISNLCCHTVQEGQVNNRLA
jgi:hypothetical protein